MANIFKNTLSEIALTKPRILITGGTRGIGAMIAEGLLAQYDLVILSKNPPQNPSMKRSETHIQYIQADVTHEADVKKAFAQLQALDGIITCAGILGPVATLEESNMVEWLETLKVNLFGTALCCKYALPILKHTAKAKGTRAKILMISGGGAAGPRMHHAAYAASKAGVVRLAETLAKEEPELDVNALAPGAHKTDLWSEETFDEEPKKWADPERLKETVRFFMSKKSDGITGKFIHINDHWETMQKKVSTSDLYTLRRIEDRDEV